MMKIILLILLSVCTLLKAEYPRYKIRGPPYPPRIPTSQQFLKKWHQPPQYPLRGPMRRPIQQVPHMMHEPYKIPMGIPQAPPRPIAQPVRTFWKNTQASLKFSPEKIYHSQPPSPPPPLPEKPFLSAPSTSIRELDYHIQTNNIPTTYTNPIKQIGEKGPIHTIPAPNLSLRDKPIIVEEVRNEINYQHPSSYVQVDQHPSSYVQVDQHPSTYVQVEQSHHYQVTEVPEPSPSQTFFRSQPQNQQLQQQQIQQQHIEQQQIHQQQIQQQQVQQQQLQQQQIKQQHLQQQQQNLYQLQTQQQPKYQQEHSVSLDAKTQFEKQPQHPFFFSDLGHSSQNPQQNSPQEDLISNNHLTPQELYQLIGSAYPREEQQQREQVSDYQTLLSQQTYQPEASHPDHLLESESAQIISGKHSFQPDFQSFNYDEQAHQKSMTKKQLSSLVSATYNLAADQSQYIPRNSADQVAQSEIIQNYFEKRSDVADNDIEPDAKSTSKTDKSTDEAEKTLLGSSYYSSLPNKETAERLAQLQAAGKVNSNLMKISSNSQKSNEPIFIPDDSTSDNGVETEENTNENNSKKGSVEYDEYEEEYNSASEEHNEGFGHKIQVRERPE